MTEKLNETSSALQKWLRSSDRANKIQYLKELTSWNEAESAGRARADFLAAVAEFQPETDTEVVLSLDLLGTDVCLHANGAITSGKDAADFLSRERQDGRFHYYGINPKVSALMKKPIGSAGCNKVGSYGHVVPCGMTLVLGGADKAKTPLVHALASDVSESYLCLAYGEPLSGQCIDAEELAVTFVAALASHDGPTDIVIDSIKDLLATASGGAMKSGIARGVLPFVSTISAVAATCGVTVYAPINPSTEDAKLMEDLVGALKSNVASAWVPDGETWVATSRRGEGLRRDTFQTRIAFDDDGLLVFTSSARTKDCKTKSDLTLSAPVSNTAFDAAVRRLFRH